MGRAQRTKGHSYERKVAQDFRGIGYPEAGRHLEYQEDEANGIDLKGTGCFLVQTKAMKKQPNIPEVMLKIKGSNGTIPLIVFKIDNKGEYAVFRWKDAQSLIKRWGD